MGIPGIVIGHRLRNDKKKRGKIKGQGIQHQLAMATYNENSLDRGQSPKIRFRKFPGSGPEKLSELLCFPFFFPGKINKILPKLRFSKPSFGPLHRVN